MKKAINKKGPRNDGLSGGMITPPDYPSKIKQGHVLPVMFFLAETEVLAYIPSRFLNRKIPSEGD